MSATSMRELTSEVVGRSPERRLYDEDFWAWTQEQAQALRRRDSGAIDWDNVIEEIETLGRSEESAWTSCCQNVISHLLKIEHSSVAEAVNNWRKEIVAWREEMYRKLRKHPGMKGKLSEMLAEAWEDGRKEAVEKLAEHGSSDNAAAEDRLYRSWQQRLPVKCPYALEDIVGYNPFVKEAAPLRDVWPAPVARVLNEELGLDYPVRRRARERESARSR